MGLFDPITDLFSSVVSGVLGGPTYQSNVGGSYQPSTSGSFLPVTYSPEYPMAQPVMAAAPMVMTGTRALMARFPSLWAALTAMSERFGTRITVDRLWSMFKQFGPGIGALIGVEALQELMVYRATHKRRRMNVANTKALRRSVRRLKGFDRLSHRVSGQLARVGHRRGGSRSRARCGTCRKSPCAC